MNVFDTHKKIVDDYADYIGSFINISDEAISRTVAESLSEGRLWPQPLLQFNPAYEQAGAIDRIVSDSRLHDDIRHIFNGYSLYTHQQEAIELGLDDRDFVVTSGTGSGKSLTYIGTIFNHLLENPALKGVVAVIVYPMNALINSQTLEIESYRDNYEEHNGQKFPITFGQYTGQENEERRQEMREDCPQILLTNYMMLELLLTRMQERPIRNAIFDNLRYLVFDELHTYRGRQGADVAMLIRRIRAQCKQSVSCIGTSATMVSTGSAEAQRSDVAGVASKVFGKEFGPDQIVDETLTYSLDGSGEMPSSKVLLESINTSIDIGSDESALRAHPVARWLENRIALENRDGRLIRRKPMRFDEVIETMSEDSGADHDQCRKAIETTLQWVSGVNQSIQDSGSKYTILPFKLHQFIAQTGSVYTSLDQGGDRFITLEPGLYKDDDREKPIFPNVFSRTTGYPFICVTLSSEGRLVPREFRELTEDEETTDGYLIIGDEVWNPEEDTDNLPDAWFRVRKDGERVPLPARRAYFPKKLYFDEYGNYSETENDKLKYWGWFMKARLLFDPTSGEIYERQNEGTKLTRLGSEGRSTSTTITAFSVLNRLRDFNQPLKDQKLLSFTDSRQDAALQSGHFNDFVQIVRLRAGIRKALENAEGSIDYTTLGEAVYTAMALPFTEFANREDEPELSTAKRRYEEAFKTYLFYRALGDLRRSWRIVLPNLEQCALLDISYQDLDEIASEDGFWSDMEILNALDHGQRRELISVVLDFFRYEYAIHSENFLAPEHLKKFEKQFREDLKAPWTLDPDENLDQATVIRLDPLHRGVRLPNKSMGPASLLGKYIKDFAKQHDLDRDSVAGEHYRNFIRKLMKKLTDADYLFERTARNAANEEVPVYQLRIGKILWNLGDGEKIRQDPVKRRAYKGQVLKPNTYFREVYSRDFSSTKRLESADHTGQLSLEARQDCEDRFRAEWYEEGTKTLDEERIKRRSISALFCSPTMELGVDIGGLSVVHMRNVPPNAANYVQRSGRAGRSGQGALVFTYCSGFAPHDRHYFNHQAEMVAGVVQAPRLDLCNRELLVTHLHALAMTAIGLPGIDSGGGEQPSLLKLVVDYEQDPKMPLASGVKDGLKLGQSTHDGIKATFLRVIGDFAAELAGGSHEWYTDDWIDQSLGKLAPDLNKAMVRWRNMYKSAQTQLKAATRPLESGRLQVGSQEYRKYKRQQDRTNHQLNLLRNQQKGSKELSEFYPYRYLAAEGYLPGYNFTRLPLRIYLPTGPTTGEYISRSRSVALREFGPHNVIYHEGSKYRVSQLVIQEAETTLSEAKVSSKSGYFLRDSEYNLEICPFSGQNLSDNENKEHLNDLLEMAETRGEETARITCEEEERITLGYQIESYFLVDSGDCQNLPMAKARTDGTHLLDIRFMPAARLIRVNRGWRAQRTEGFPIGMVSGNWRKRMPDADSEVNEEHRIVKLWTSNLADSLYIEPIQALGLGTDGVVTLQHALKRAIESVFQVEPREIEVSSMGDVNKPNILIYEASEGSLGILSQFVTNVEIFRKVVEKAEEICRFDDEEYKAPASYDDLLSYFNQRDHDRLDRFLIKDALAKLKLAEIEIQANSAFNDYDDQYQHMMRNLDPNSSTERQFIQHLYENGLRLPDAAQKQVDGIYCQPDFYYEPRVWVFCDGSPHDDPEVRKRDNEQRQEIIAKGDEVWAWHYKEDLAAKVAQRSDLFRKVR